MRHIFTLFLLAFVFLQGQARCASAQSPENVDLRPVDQRHHNSVFAQPTLFQWAGHTGGGGPPGFDEPLASDRPDFTESSTTVGKRVLQIEMGYTFAHDSNHEEFSDTHSYPETLIRLGVLADWLELRAAFNIGTENVATSGGPYAATTGAEDLYLGMKLGLTSQHGWLPEMALVPQTTVPRGSSRFTSDEVLPGLNWLYGWDLTERLSMGGSTQCNKALDDDSRDFIEFAQSWTFGYSLTDRIGSYSEWFCLLPSGATTVKPEYYFDGGFTFRVTNNLQLDARGGIGLNTAAADYFLGSGAVMRF